jgi:HSP20 family protein
MSDIRSKNNHPSRIMWPFHSIFDSPIESFLDNLPSKSFWEELESPKNRVYEIRNAEQGIILETDMPGIKDKDLRIEVKDTWLIVCAKSEERKREYKMRHYISQDYDTTNISAELEDGILSISIPKKVETPGRKIEVKKK